ncbi:Ada metal-binding domain-containing protein [Salidesulfovibrio onnuriiensis]|uniref:Ada metal-binding domain-containing protein n=1 Tax=Salidesulfovibrio onnuriiensis TaxID=2583823 RepID=UPI0011C818D4|nr:Ada metal-binding domain-containing protein [Salidesulfovibrio onnuriiensis]
MRYPTRLRATLLLTVVLILFCALSVTASAPFHGNRKSRIFHQSSCRYYNCKNCVVVFETRSDAIAAGFRPCKICRP